MKRFLILCRREMRHLFCSVPLQWLNILFLLVMSGFFLLILRPFSQEPQNQLPLIPFLDTFWVGALLLIPLLSTNAIGEERRRGLLATLFSTPINSAQILLSKFLTLWIFYGLLWLLLLGEIFWTQRQMTLPIAFFNEMQFWGGWSFLLLTGAFYLAIGLFFSTIFRSSLLAAASTFVSIFALVIAARLCDHCLWIQRLPWLRRLHNSTDGFYLLQEFTSGIFDSIPITFYATGTIFLLALSILWLRPENAD